MAFLDGTEVSLDDLISFSKLHSLLSVIMGKLNEQGAAIKQLRERDALQRKFRKQVVAALQMCVEHGNENAKLEERLSALEDVTTRLPKAEEELAEAEERAKGLLQELSCAELRVEHTMASLEKKMDAQVDCKIASLEWKMETRAMSLEEKLATQAEQSIANAENLVVKPLGHVELRLESMEQRLRQVQTQEDPHVKECGVYDGTGQQPEEEERKEEDEEIIAAPPKAAMTSIDPIIPVGLLFPGQGSEHLKMMNSFQDLPAVKTMLENAKVILGWDVLELCLKGPMSKLQETKFCHPVMFIAGLAAMERLRQVRKEVATHFRVTSGINAGLYAALCAAGVFSFEDGLKLVDIRGRAIQEAASIRKQAALWVDGLEKPTLEELCKKAQKAEATSAVCQIISEVHPYGFCCAGTVAAVSCLKHMSEKAGAKARLLRGLCAMATPLMAPANEKVGKALDEMLPRMNPPRHAVCMTTTAEPIKPGTKPKAVVELLKRHLTSTEKWESSVWAMIKSGVNEFYTMGPSFFKVWMSRMDAEVWRTITELET